MLQTSEMKTNPEKHQFQKQGYEYQDILIAILLTLRELCGFWSVGEMTEEGKKHCTPSLHVFYIAQKQGNQ